MTGLFLMLLRLIGTPLGRTVAEVVGAVLVFLAAWALFASHYEAKGEAKEKAKTTAALSDLAQCHASLTGLEAAADAQSRIVAAKSKADAQSLADAQKAVAAAQGEVKKATDYRAAIKAPLPVNVPQAATQAVTCPVTPDLAARLAEIDRRATQ